VSREPAWCLLGTSAASNLVSTQRPAQCASGRPCHFGFGIITALTPRVVIRGRPAVVDVVSHPLPPRSTAATAVVAHDVEVGC
jgi:hypothetical protein